MKIVSRIALVVIAVLIAVGAFFFTFEEFDEEEEGYDQSAQVQEDPYAWAKAKQVPAIATQPAAQAVAQVATPARRRRQLRTGVRTGSRSVCASQVCSATRAHAWSACGGSRAK